MKKKVLSAEALTRLKQAAETEAAEVEGVAMEASTAIDEPEMEVEAMEEAPPDLPDVEALTAQLTESQANLEAAAAKVATLEQELTKLKADLVASTESSKQAECFRPIVEELTNNMRTACSLVKVDLSKSSVETLLAEYESATEAFEKIPIGSVVPEAKTEEKNKPMTSLEAAAFRSLGF